MVSEQGFNQGFSDSIKIRFNGKNYSIWEFSFRTFIQGKGFLAYLDGTNPSPTLLSLADLKVTWAINNARVLSYLIGSVESTIALTLRSFPSAAAAWDHLRKTYSHVNTSRFFYMEYALANLNQGELTITDYYLAATTLWTEIDLISTSLISVEANTEILKERQRSRSLQFLMRLRPEYEQVRSRLIAEDKTNMDNILGELIRVETRFQTQAQLDGQSHPATSGSVFAAGDFRPRFQSTPRSSTLDRSNTTSGPVKCHFCQEFGHPQSLCRKRNICSYCKKSGHLIPDCTARG
ncbi:hypothetical protein LINGRAPRIM_LOCUS2980 [Linum grandiflorum]